MVFRWKITRPPFHHAAEGVDVMQPGIEVEFETGSIGEAHGIYTDNKTALGEMFGAEIVNRASDLASDVGDVETNEQTGETKKERKTRGPNKPKPDAVAPAPIAIPGAEAPPIVPATHPLDIPEALRRPAAVAPPPAPPAPVAPPAAPPTGVLAGKIIAEMERKGVPTAPDGGQSFADWLATSGITVKGATYAEAVTVLRLQADEKLGSIAQALGVA